MQPSYSQLSIAAVPNLCVLFFLRPSLELGLLDPKSEALSIAPAGPSANYLLIMILAVAFTCWRLPSFPTDYRGYVFVRQQTTGAGEAEKDEEDAKGKRIIIVFDLSVGFRDTLYHKMNEYSGGVKKLL